MHDGRSERSSHATIDCFSCYGFQAPRLRALPPPLVLTNLLGPSWKTDGTYRVPEVLAMSPFRVRA